MTQIIKERNTLNSALNGALTSGLRSSLARSGNLILPVTNGLLLQIAAFQSGKSKSELVTVDGSDAVSAWLDLSGNNNNASQANQSRKPTYIVNGINGLPAVSFDGDVLATPNFNTIFSDEAVIFIVATINSTGVFFNYELNQSSVEVRLTLLRTGNNLRFDIPNGSSGLLNGSVNIATTSHIFTAYKSSTTQTIYIDGSSDATQSNSGSFAPGSINDPFFIGARDATAGLPTTMILGEMIIYNGTISITEKEQVEKYLSKKWRIPLN